MSNVKSIIDSEGGERKMSEKDLRKELQELEKTLKKKLENKEIDPDDAIDTYLEKQAEIEAGIEMLKREDGKYCRKLFEENIKGLQMLKAGVIGKTRLDIQNMTFREAVLENVKDLRRIRNAITGWKFLHKHEEVFLNAIVKLLLVSVRQNQILIQKLASE